MQLKDMAFKLNHEESNAFKKHLLLENIRSLKIIAIIGSLINVIIIAASYKIQGLAILESWDIRTRMLWIAASAAYFILVGRPTTSENIKPYQSNIFFFAASLSLFFSAIITGLTSLTTGYTFLFIINCMLTAAFLCLSLKEIVLIMLPSILYLGWVVITNEHSQLIFLGNVMNILSTVVFSLAICSRAYDRQKHLFHSNLMIYAHNQMLLNLAELDGLTQLPNRRKFDQVLDISWTHCHREGTPLSLIMLDVDLFKHYNDTYGHLAGDYCLKKIAEVLKRVVHRESDLVARYGGEEFVVLLPMTAQSGALQLAEEIRSELYDEKILHEGVPFAFITLSLGVSTVTDYTTLTRESLIHQADQALYKSKVSGRNSVSCFESPLESSY